MVSLFTDKYAILERSIKHYKQRIADERARINTKYENLKALEFLYTQLRDFIDLKQQYLN